MAIESNRSSRIFVGDPLEKIEDRIADLVRRHRSFLVCSHMNPDGDAVGSSVALALFLEGEGKEVFVHNQSPIPTVYASICGVKRFHQSIPLRMRFDVSFLLDCSKPNRVGKAFEDFPGKGKVVVIDHHPPTEPPGGIHLIRPKASATGELLYSVLRAYGADLTPEIATALYLALITDTGSFQFSNTTAMTHAVAAELLRAGASHGLLIDQLYENHPAARFMLLGRVLRTLRFLFEGRVATLEVPRTVYHSVDADEDLTEGFVNILRSISGVEVALLIKEIAPEEFKVSLRSRGSVDVGLIASKFQGGGHPNAAGCTLYGGGEEVYQTMLKTVGEALQ
jgi:phosphoesterase RecJ-like protein